MSEKHVSHRVRVWLRRSLLVLIAVVGIGGVMAWIVGSRLVAPCPRQVGDPPSGLHAVAIEIESRSDATLSGWHCVPSDCRGVIVLLHGIRGN
ncbi:hypothetical protein C2E31_27835 [Rhodopirellula baltica]|nr:hypothetical protein C2E31_27835 [Rhodopirellula baltica]